MKVPTRAWSPNSRFRGWRPGVRKDDVVIRGQSKKYVRISDEGNKITFSFCPDGGANVHFKIDGLTENIAIPVGRFVEPGFPEPPISVYEERMHACVGLPVSIEHMA